MAIHTIVDKDFDKMMENSTFAAFSLVMQMFYDCFPRGIKIPYENVTREELEGYVPHCCPMCKYDRQYNINPFFMHRHIGDLEVGEAVALDDDRLIIITTPSPSDDDDADCNSYEVLKKCYRGALECAYGTGAEIIVLPPFYAFFSCFKSETVYPAAMETADEFLSEKGDGIEIFILVNSQINTYKVFSKYKHNQYSLEKEYPDDWEERLQHMAENADPFEKSLRLSSRWRYSIVENYRQKMLRADQERYGAVKERDRLIKENESLSNAAYDRETFIKFITDRVGAGKKYSQNEFAAKSGVDVANLNKIIKGKRSNITKETAIKIALGLELDARDFKKCVLCSGNAFPQDDRDREILRCVKEGEWDYITISEYLETIGRNK